MTYGWRMKDMDMKENPKNPPCTRSLGDKSSSELLNLCLLVFRRRVRARKGSGRRSWCAALVAAGAGSDGCSSPALPQCWSPAALQHSSTGREALAALGSCLISLCLELSRLDALSSDMVWRRENKRHSCCVRGAQGAELSHGAVRHVPLTDPGCSKEAATQK